MSFLPIVDRELRVAARRKGSYRIRFWTALLAMLSCFLSLGFFWMARGRAGAGAALFDMLTGYAFGLCLLAGVFFTANTLSEEYREGTLGLLFLTDLKGYDIVLGKFIATSLTAFYGLLALLPLTGMPLLLGGVTAGEFWRSALCLVNALFFSLATGIWVSAWSRDPRRAMGSTFALLLFLSAGWFLLCQALRAVAPSWVVSLAAFSPLAGFVSSNDALYQNQPGHFWRSLLFSQSLSWFFLAHASLMAPRFWQRQGLPSEEGLVARLFRRRTGNAAKRLGLRQRLLAVNPVLWLMGGDTSVRRLIWAIILVWGAVVSVVGLLSRENPLWVYWGAKICGFILKMLIALQACRFFAEARRDGSLELLLCTPLRNTEILKGQWLAFRRLFVLPLLVFLGINFVPALLHIFRALTSLNWSALGEAALGFGGTLFLIGYFTLTFVADTFALMWFGMWLALTMKKPNFAAPLTILLVLVVPSFLSCGDLAADIFFILWGSIKLQQDLRGIVARQSEQRTLAVAPPVLRAPPVIR
jgi:ABC-type transport system involved in multi-copper enzyme maturation permease subunit